MPRWLRISAAYGWRLLVVAAVAALLAVAIIRVSVIVIPLLLGLMIAAALAPLALWLRGVGLPPLLATWAVLLASLVFVAGVAWLLVPGLITGFEDVGAAAVESYEEVRTWFIDGPLGLDESTVDEAEEAIVSRAGEFARTGLTSRAVLAVEVIAAIFLTFVVSFFYIKDGPEFRDAIVRRLPPEQQARAENTLQVGWGVLQRYLIGVVVVGLVDAVLIGVGLAVIGVPLVLSLAALTFFAAFFPLVGAILAGGVAALVALAAGGIGDALLVAGLTVVVQQLDGDVVAPMVYSRAVNLHPLAILLSLTAGGIVAGLIGALLAVPLLAVSAAMVKKWNAHSTDELDSSDLETSLATTETHQAPLHRGDHS